MIKQENPTVKSNSVVEKNVKLMSQDELLDYMQNGLKDKGITSVDDLFSYLRGSDLTEDNQLQTAFRRYMRFALADYAETLTKCTSSSEIGTYLQDKYSYLDQEEFIIISLDNQNRILSEDCASVGTIDKAVVSMSVVVRKLVENNAASFFVCHNHPSGKLLPSSADFKVTERLEELGELLQIEMLDHIIVGQGNYLSMAEHNML